MPIFEYHCRHCRHHFETIVLSTREKVSCPKCDSSAVEKQLSVFSSPGSAKEGAASAGGCACTPQTCGCH
ncbi:MAG TPA: zinc ribbon domain-containing protein [Candidatus Binatia bacterium]|nr:zinc ribbon domain-containing protein [Candidatus Binatia bacterium]